jgi:hypothetical protein
MAKGTNATTTNEQATRLNNGQRAVFSNTFSDLKSGGAARDLNALFPNFKAEEMLEASTQTFESLDGGLFSNSGNPDFTEALRFDYAKSPMGPEFTSVTASDNPNQKGPNVKVQMRQDGSLEPQEKTENPYDNDRGFGNRFSRNEVEEKPFGTYFSTHYVGNEDNKPIKGEFVQIEELDY